MKINNKKLVLIVLIVCLLFVVSIIATYFGKPSSVLVQPVNSTRSFDYRLPSNLKPILYDITLKIDLEQFNFNGSINISFKCLNPTNKIIFHLKELNLLNETIQVFSHFDSINVFVFKKWLYDYETELISLLMYKQCLVNKTYSLAFNYTGQIGNTQIGLYKTSYLDARNQLKYFVASKFEPVYARRAIPCFDEPNMKAKFKLKIIREKMYRSSFSNVKLNFTEAIADTKWEIDHYDLSEKTSTYLLSIVVSDLSTINTKLSKFNSSIQIIYNELTSQQIKFSLLKINQIIEFISELLNLTYPYNITPQVSIPSNNTGFLSNAGVINKIYKRERNNEFNKLIRLQDNKRLITSVLTHELAHQWFGYLVTPEWWSDLWLNEGFVTYIEYLFLNHINPELNEIENLFIDTLGLMVRESIELNISSVKNLNIQSQNQIKSQFNSLAYEKAAALIHFMISLIKIENFQQAVSTYLIKYKFSNVNQYNLLHIVSNNTNYTIISIMDSWTLNRGYPVIKLDKIELNNNRMQIKLSQQRFLLNTNIAQDTIWKIPIQIKTINTTSDLVWLNECENTIEIDNSNNKWLIGYFSSGYYRINYDSKNWILLIEQLKLNHDLISPIDRAKLIDDSFNLARANHIDLSIYLNLIQYLINESNSLPIETALITLDYISDMISNDFDVYSSFKKFCRNLFRHLFDQTQFQINTNSSLTKIDSQLKIFRLMCNYGEIECINLTNSYYKNWRNKNESFPFLFDAIILDTFIQNSNDPKDWYDLLEIYFKDKNFKYLNALTYTQNYNLIRVLLNKFHSNSFKLSKSESLDLLTSIAKNRIGSYLVLDYINDYWSNLYLNHGNVLFEIIEIITSKFNSENDLVRKNNFISDKSELNSIKNYLNSKIELNIKWTNENTFVIYNFLLNKNF